MLLITYEVRVATLDRDAALTIARRAIPPTLAEPGCLSYRVLCDAQDPDRIVWVEQWQDESAFRAHQASRHVAELLAAGKDIMRDPRLTIHTVERTQQEAPPE